MPLLAGFVAGCGNLTTPGQLRAPKSMRSTQLQSGGAGDGYACPGRPNIIPDFDDTLDGRGYYRACVTGETQNRIKLVGETRGDARVCAVAVEITANGQTFIKPDLGTGYALIRCATNAAVGVPLTFENTSYNALFVFDGMHEEQMLNCLPHQDAAGNIYPATYPLCPPYSFGRFR